MILDLVARLRAEGRVSIIMIPHNYVHVLAVLRPGEPDPGRRDHVRQADRRDVGRGAQRDRRRGVPARADGRQRRRGEGLSDGRRGASSGSTSARCPGAPSSCASSDGAELGSAVHEYPHGVIERDAAGDRRAAAAATGRCRTPTTTSRCCARRCPRPSRAAGVDAGGRRRHRHRLHRLDPAARRSPTARRCARVDAFRDRPHAYPKLWKHHAAQAQADRINALAAERGEPWLARYGGRISSEWEFAKALQVLEEDPEVYDAMDRWIEGADWIVWQLCGEETRNACTAGYKGICQDGGYPSARLPRGARRALRRASSPTSSRARRSRARRPRRRADRRRRRRGPACPRASRSRSATSTRTSPRPPPRRSSRARCSRSWAPRPAT